MQFPRLIPWLFHRAAIRIIIISATLLAAYFLIPKAILAEARARALSAGFEMTADDITIRPGRIMLRGMKASSHKADMRAELLTVRFDSHLRSKTITLQRADIIIKETGQNNKHSTSIRPEILLVDSKIHIARKQGQVDADVRTARLGTDGRIWIDADLQAHAGRYSVTATEVGLAGIDPEGPINITAGSIDVDVAEGMASAGNGEKDVPPEKHIGVTAKKATVNKSGERISADALKMDFELHSWGQEAHVEADRIVVRGNSAEWVSLDLSRKIAEPGRTDVSFSAGSLETENRRMSSAEFSIKKLKVRTAITQAGKLFMMPTADIHVGNAHMNASATLSNEGLHVRAEMPETECQDLLLSIPRELVPRLRTENEDTRLSGTISWRVETDVDMPARKKPNVSIWLRNKCTVESVPEELSVQRVMKPFRHDEYMPNGGHSNEMAGPGTKNWTPLSAISPLMPAAVMAMEDPSFMSHRGILIQAIENSMEQNIAAGKFVRGGSTISMQLAKNLWLAREKTVSRKIQEAVLTTYLEQKMTKAQIIELYLNIVEFGPNLYGIGPAARRYFAKDPGNLTLSQSLFLASLLPSPRSAGFEEGKKISQGRLDLLRKVMKMMLDRGTIGPTQYEQGLKETPVFGDPSVNGDAESEIKIPGGIDPSEWK